MSVLLLGYTWCNVERGSSNTFFEEIVSIEESNVPPCNISVHAEDTRLESKVLPEASAGISIEERSRNSSRLSDLRPYCATPF